MIAPTIKNCTTMIEVKTKLSGELEAALPRGDGEKY